MPLALPKGGVLVHDDKDSSSKDPDHTCMRLAQGASLESVNCEPASPTTTAVAAAAAAAAAATSDGSGGRYL